ncbi:MAG: DM13 domain-containing protein [Candidatus Kerfeldbacteria bacterium]|nr:DM13 domain-containing protein [Candidatus Kerfeldbacteria bacterium]
MWRPFFVILTSVFLLLGAGCQARRGGEQYPYPDVGSVGAFQEYRRWGITGGVTVVDQRTLRFNNFSFNGGELKTEIRLQRERNKVATLKDITGQTYTDAAFDLTLPEGVGLDDFNLVTVFVPELGAPVSGAEFGD